MPCDSLIVAERVHSDSLQREAENWHTLFVLTRDAERLERSQSDDRELAARLNLQTERTYWLGITGGLIFILLISILR